MWTGTACRVTRATPIYVAAGRLDQGCGAGGPFEVPFFFKQKTAYEIGVRLVGSEMCIRDSYAKGMHHEVVQQLCRPQIDGLAGRPSYGLLKEVDGTGKPFSRNHGERVPDGQVPVSYTHLTLPTKA